MATYQEQIARQETAKARDVILLLHDLGTIGQGLTILLREKIIDNEARIALLAKFVHQHPEIEKYMRASTAAGEGSRESK